MAKGKAVKGSKFVAVDEVYDKKTRKKEDKSMKTAGIEVLLKKSQKDEGFSNKPRVQGEKKPGKLVHGQKKVK